MPPNPLPHRVSFLSPVIALAASEAHLPLLAAKVVQAMTFDHLARHRIVAIDDFNDHKLTDADHHLLDIRHPHIETTIDWQFRANRRDEVTWFDISADPHVPTPAVLMCRRPDGSSTEFSATATDPLHAQMDACIDQWLRARRLPPAPAPMATFFASDIATAIHQLDKALVAEHEGDGVIPVYLRMPPPRLGAAFYLVLQDLCHSIAPADLDREILELDPDNLIARLNTYHHNVRDGGSRDFDTLFALMDEAPMWYKPHLAVHGDAFADDGSAESITTRHQSRAVTLTPSNPWANRAYALELGRAARTEEALRWAERSTRVDPAFWQGHIENVRLARRCGRAAEALAVALKRCTYVIDMYRQGHAVDDGSAQAVTAGMQLAFAHEDIGDLAEAAAIGATTIDDAASSAPGWAVDRVGAWRDEPDALCNAFARDGYHRGEPGRVIEGFGFGGLDKSTDVAMLIESLIAVGREDIALLAFAHYRDGRLHSPRARLAGAKAHILGGDLVEAMEQIQTCELRFSQSRMDSEINRLLRLGACRPIRHWEQVIQRYRTLGAPSLARMAARDIADFVPAATDSQIVAAALGDTRSIAIEPTWLAGLQRSVAEALDTAALDAVLALPTQTTQTTQTTRKEADLLVAGWFDAMPSRREAPDAFAAGAIYALGRALTSYLALSAGAPSVLAGAYRHIATDALELVRAHRSRLQRDWVRGLFEALEHMTFADDGTFDRWVLRVERALAFHAHAGSYASQITTGLPRTADSLRGDERVAFELHLAFDLAADGAAHDPARVLFERSQRATESGAAAVQWSAIADATLPPDEALDVHWIAALCNPDNHAGPWLNLAKGLFERGAGIDAVRSLVRAFVPADPGWRQAQIDAMRTVWASANIEVPVDPLAALERGAELLESDPVNARRCFRWCAAADPSLEDAREELAEVTARTGRAAPTIRVFSAMDRASGPLRAARALLTAGHPTAALSAYRYASIYFATAAHWREYADVACRAGDWRTGADAFDELIVQHPGAADDALLAAFAAALANTGQWARCELVAEQLIALGATERAGEVTKMLPARQPDENSTSAPTSGYPLETRAFDALRASDADKVQALAREGDSWVLFRAAMAASEMRLGPDAPAVSSTALAAADHVLERSAGATNADAALAHIRALRVIENAHICVDPPPPLGPRLTREQFSAELARRRSITD